MPRFCDTCGTKLPGKAGHGFVTKKGGISCGRNATQMTVIKNGAPSLVYVDLPCQSAI